MGLAGGDSDPGSTFATAITPALPSAPGASAPLLLDSNRLAMAGFPVIQSASQDIRFRSRLENILIYSLFSCAIPGLTGFQKANLALARLSGRMPAKSG